MNDVGKQDDDIQRAYNGASAVLPALQKAFPDMDVLVTVGMFRTGDMGPDGKPIEWPACSRREVRIVFREK